MMSNSKVKRQTSYAIRFIRNMNNMLVIKFEHVKLSYSDTLAPEFSTKISPSVQQGFVDSFLQVQSLVS